jgi:hypothetical protein
MSEVQDERYYGVLRAQNADIREWTSVEERKSLGLRTEFGDFRELTHEEALKAGDRKGREHGNLILWETWTEVFEKLGI